VGGRISWPDRTPIDADPSKGALYAIPDSERLRERAGRELSGAPRAFSPAPTPGNLLAAAAGVIAAATGTRPRALVGQLVAFLSGAPNICRRCSTRRSPGAREGWDYPPWGPRHGARTHSWFHRYNEGPPPVRRRPPGNKNLANRVARNWRLSRHVSQLPVTSARAGGWSVSATESDVGWRAAQRGRRMPTRTSPGPVRGR